MGIELAIVLTEFIIVNIILAFAVIKGGSTIFAVILAIMATIRLMIHFATISTRELKNKIIPIIILYFAVANIIFTLHYVLKIRLW